MSNGSKQQLHKSFSSTLYNKLDNTCKPTNYKTKVHPERKNASDLATCKVTSSGSNGLAQFWHMPLLMPTMTLTIAYLGISLVILIGHTLS